MRSYPVKENPIGSAVSEILRYKQTNRHTDIVLLCIIDDLCLLCANVFPLLKVGYGEGLVFHGAVSIKGRDVPKIKEFSVINDIFQDKHLLFFNIGLYDVYYLSLHYKIIKTKKRI